jgi:hypothetical protein
VEKNMLNPNEENKQQKGGEKKRNEPKVTIEPEDIMSDELIRWMTEGTSPNFSPRSDCG